MMIIIVMIIIILTIINDKKDDDDNLLTPGQLWFPWRLEDYQGPKPLRRRAPTFVYHRLHHLLLQFDYQCDDHHHRNDHQHDHDDHDDDQRLNYHYP